MEIQIYSAAAQLGVAIPHDLPVVGFDDRRVFSEGLLLALTTVALPYKQMGRIAADLLTAPIDDRSAAGIIPVEGPLIERASTAPVAN